MKQVRVAIYTRVSTDDQSTKTQEHELRQYAKNRRWTLQRVYTDHGFSGASEKRPALDELLRDTRKRKFDVVLVWKFDRFARSLRQLVSALELFRKFGIDFVSATEAIPAGAHSRCNARRCRGSPWHTTSSNPYYPVSVIDGTRSGWLRHMAEHIVSARNRRPKRTQRDVQIVRR